MSRQKSRAFIEYFLRSLITLVLGSVLIFAGLKAILSSASDTQDSYRMIDILGELDVLHDAFYAVLPAVLLILFKPCLKKNHSGNRLRSFFIDAVAIQCGAVPLVSFLLRRDPWNANLWVIVSCLYITVNVYSILSGQLGEDVAYKSSALKRYAWPVSDILFPSALWCYYRKKAGPAANILRLIPAAFVAFVVFLPWIIRPVPIAGGMTPDRAFSRILPGSFYQVFREPSSPDLFAVSSNTHTIFRIPDRDGLRAIRFEDDAIKNFQASALDVKTGRMIYMGFRERKSRVLNADSLQPVRLLDIEQTQTDPLPLCRSYWFPQRPLLFTLCDHGLTLMCPNGRQAKARFTNQPGDVLYDTGRDEILFLAWYSGLTAFDPGTLNEIKRLALPKVVERMVMDETHDRLFISAPKLSLVIEVDLKTFSVTRRVPVLPGARVLAVDPDRGLLFVGSMSPYLEIRSLEDYAIIRRLSSPPWMRWMFWDREAGRLDVTTGQHGLWELDLAKVDISGNGNFLERYDPFFRLFDWISVELQNRFRWQESIIDPIHPKPSEHLLYGECAHGLWTDDP